MARWFRLRFVFTVGSLFRLRVSQYFNRAPFPHPARQTGRADLPHPAFVQGVMVSPTESCGCDVPVESVPTRRTGTHWGMVRVPEISVFAFRITTDEADDVCVDRSFGRPCSLDLGKSSLPSPIVNDSGVPLDRLHSRVAIVDW